ncbi:unnamed protein product [Notodromas monacha]|uniref:Uncharacterized protein n=1 Tax=Notodromas monacha TaxID=399045 RepID=A0A7R9BGN8_9CRUS|nr:unnamed protein product [Notodromas monacha]CAG0913525.1 unnamed protein product [Notodromas monacha]
MSCSLCNLNEFFVDGAYTNMFTASYHSIDRKHWAVENDFQLMLGSTIVHAGQPAHLNKIRVLIMLAVLLVQYLISSTLHADKIIIIMVAPVSGMVWMHLICLLMVHAIPVRARAMQFYEKLLWNRSKGLEKLIFEFMLYAAESTRTDAVAGQEGCEKHSSYGMTEELIKSLGCELLI